MSWFSRGAIRAGDGARRLPTEEQVADVYRELADSYSDERARTSRERAWQRIDVQLSLRKKRGSLAAGPTWNARSRRRRVLGYSLAAALFGVSLLWISLPGDEELEYALEGGTLKNGWVITSDQMATLQFSDGSALELSAESAININSLGRHSALTRLARGSVRVDVEHHEDTSWTFLAGPYEVRVEGTAFDLSWASERLALSMHEGRVRVVGPDQREWVLRQGDQLVVPPVLPESMPNEPVADTPEPEREPLAALPEEQTESSPSTARPSSNWNRLLREGRFSEIVNEARRAGPGSVVRSRPISDIVALGQAARYTGDADLAENSWKAIRARAPHSGSARQAAFFLGRIMEQQGRRADAIHWFSRYREESPSGVYADQALGRQMVLTSGQGKSSSARELAQAYLRSHPNGPYATAASGMLGERAVDGDVSGAIGSGDAIPEE